MTQPRLIKATEFVDDEPKPDVHLCTNIEIGNAKEFNALAPTDITTFCGISMPERIAFTHHRVTCVECLSKIEAFAKIKASSPTTT